ncbi:MAG: undecaprenyldiphospho-muramoylpentapeptide beta-N-acetylglucosaminyltransferase [Magnetococcales bacterium]|nr:undecaprenyldiphospho-muramoylpentapeptide beta-N-acetylglucosaminyltransferase [Magnetococcales bacterium]
MSCQGKKLLIAGGGTGGHLFPALAICEEWEAQGGEVLFVGTPRGLENRILPQKGKNLALINVGKIKGGGITGRIKTVLGLPMALMSAIKILREFKPDVVLGVGGYASTPAVAAARLLFIPTAIHEQNAMPGLSNRMLSRIATKIFISFSAAKEHFAHKNIQLTGNPVNQEFHNQAIKPPPKEGEPWHILIFGGSLGAKVFGEIVPPALAQLKEEGINFQVQHQVQTDSIEQVQKFYNENNITAQTAAFFHNMSAVYAKADIVICRAGATTVTELSALGKPALLIPYPYAADDHQAANAQAYADKGAGWMRRQEETTPQWLTDFLKQCFKNPAELKSKAQNAKKLATPNAAQDIVKGLLGLLKHNKIDNS